MAGLVDVRGLTDLGDNHGIRTSTKSLACPECESSQYTVAEKADVESSHGDGEDEGSG